jgi:DNA-binding NtrC family response regulator
MIFVDSEKNKGTIFTFVLPAAPEEAQEGLSRAVSASSVRPTILLVDDEQVICDVVGDIISQMGYQAITAGSGEAALDIFRSHRDQIDLVIIDMVMPDMPGYQVIEAIRAMAPEIKAILISGFPESEAVQHAMRDTRQVFLQKPLQTGTLSTAIRLLLEV